MNFLELGEALVGRLLPNTMSIFLGVTGTSPATVDYSAIVHYVVLNEDGRVMRWTIIGTNVEVASWFDRMRDAP